MDNDIVHMAKGGKKIWNPLGTLNAYMFIIYYVISTMPYAMHKLIMKTHI